MFWIFTAFPQGALNPMTDLTPTSNSTRPLRTDWHDFPPEYITALKVAGREGFVRLGPMSWNNARFSQREFYRLVAVLRRQAPTDPEAATLDNIARQLRVSCPRCDEDVTQHWFMLQANPIVEGMRSR